MTDGYDRQGPMLLPVMDVQAVRLHWNHSILQERDFLPEWQAQVHASTLAAELGHKETLVVDVFALPLRRKPRQSKVTFDEEVVVYMGLYDDPIFRSVTMQHHTLSSWQGKPWTVRALPEYHIEDEFEEGDRTSFMARRPTRFASSDGERTSETAASSSTTSSSMSHSSTRQTVLILLDGRMLPASLPWSDGEALATQVSQVTDIDKSELLAVHYVSHRPSDLVRQDLQCLLLQIRSEVRPSPFVSLILIDLEIYEPNEVLPGAFRRFSKWLPMTLNRVSAFRLLDLEPLLIAHPESSRLWHNHVLIPDGQISPLHLADGDFIKVVIGQHEGGFDCSDSDLSSFSIEEEQEESDQVSTLQRNPPSYEILPSFADADPLSLQAVCISGSCDQLACKPRVSSMNEPFSFFEGTGSHTERTHPGRPPRVESPYWHQEIWDLLCDEGATEMEEEGPIIYVKSFFISHAHTTVNKVSRPLRFDAEHETWEASVRFMWEDFIDPTAPLELLIVSPSPPATIYEGTVATVLVVQHPLPQKFAIVVTAHPDTQEIRHARSAAISVGPLVTQTQLVEAAEVQDLCSSPGCTTWIGQRELPVAADIRVHDGLGVQLKIPATRVDPSSRSIDLIASQQPHETASTSVETEEEHEDITLLSLQANHLQGMFTSTLRLLGPALQQRDGNFEVPIPDTHPVHGQDINDGRHLDELYEHWHQVTPIFAISIEEAAVTFTSWFVHCNIWPTCDNPRRITLFPQRQDWDRQIRSLWRDRMQPGQAFEVSIIAPADDEDPSPGHILVHQGLNSRHKGILLSTFHHAGSSQLHSRRAVVAPKRIVFPDLVHFAGFHVECQTREFLCVGFFGRESLDEVRPLFPQTGAHFELHLVDWTLVPTAAGQSCPLEETEDHDISSYMQADRHRFTRAPRTCGVNLPEQPHESSPFQFQINAPVFVPGIPWDLHTHDEFIQDLFEAWNQVAVAWENEERSSLILTWFVDHQWPNPHGRTPRSVRLFSDLQDWRRQISQAWQDHVVLGQELEYHLVTPQPYTVDRRIAAHVVVIQRPNEQWVTNVVTLFDERTLQTTVSQLAITTHEHILLDNLARVFGIFDVCFGTSPTLLCHAWYRDLALAAGAPIPGRSGLSINVLVRPRPIPLPAEVLEERDEHSLLVLSGKSVPFQDDSQHAASISGVDFEDAACDRNSAAQIGPSALISGCKTERIAPKSRQCKISDQPNQGLAQNAGSAPHLTPVPMPTHAAAPVGIPTFVFDMMRDLQAHMLRTDGNQQGFVVRVWYIHHIHRRMSRIARYLHLSGPPHLWQPRIVALWADRLVPFEAIAICLAQPRPFRTTHEQHLAFDLIVTQGVQEPRRSGLISVYPSHPDPTFPQFAVAVSFRPQVSGEWLVRKLAFQQVCQVHRCQIFHRWNEIPQTPDLTHEMSNGDSFDIHIHRNGPGLAELQPSPQPSHLDVHPPDEDQAAATEEEATEGPILLQLHSLLHQGDPSLTDIKPLTRLVPVPRLRCRSALLV